MNTAPSPPPAAPDLLARQIVAAAIGAALREPRPAQDDPAPDAARGRLVGAAWEFLADRAGDTPRSSLGLGELAPLPAQAEPLVRWLALPHAVRERAFRAAFGLTVAKECPPFETEFLPSRDAAARAQHMADIAGFYNAFGLEPDPARPLRPDHVGAVLGFVAFLLEKRALLGGPGRGTDPSEEGAEICESALKAFIKDHIAWWIPTFGRCLELRAEEVRATQDPQTGDALASLAGIGQFLRAWASVERRAEGVEPSRRILGPSVASDGPDNDCDGCAEACTIPADDRHNSHPGPLPGH